MRAKKSFGQHFLHSPGVLSHIVQVLDPAEDELVIEIGPGTGQLTRQLVARVGSSRVVCLEKDRDMVAHLSDKLPDVRVIQGDATRTEWSNHVNCPAVVVGNLPYNVSAPIYFHLLMTARHVFRRMVLMFQKEVADRFVASPGNKTFGPPSVLTWLLADAHRTMVVRPGAFRPPPKVDSAIILVDPLPSPRRDVGDDIDAFNRFVHGLFQQRRKTIQNNLKRMYGPEALSCLDDVGIERSARSEVVPPDMLVDLWRRVIDLQS